MSRPPRRVSSSLLILLIATAALSILSVGVATADSDQTRPVCHIPEGHYDGETVKYYDPEPRFGYLDTVNTYSTGVFC